MQLLKEILYNFRVCLHPFFLGGGHLKCMCMDLFVHVCMFSLTLHAVTGREYKSLICVCQVFLPKLISLSLFY